MTDYTTDSTTAIDKKEESKYIEPIPINGSVASLILYTLAMIVLIATCVLLFNLDKSDYKKLEYLSNVSTVIMICVSFGALVGLGSICNSLVKIVENTKKDKDPSSLVDSKKE